MINCKNCGAPLKNGQCEYCGSEYEFIPQINHFEQIFKINIHGKIRKFYIETIESHPIYSEFRLLDGSMCRTSITSEPQLTLTMISYD